MNIKYYVRTTGEREFNYSPLQYKTLIDTNHNSCLHYLDTLQLVKNENAVILEDDLVLCKNFQTEIERVINQYPDTIINFFTHPNGFFTTHYTDSFSFNQCTYFPAGSIDKFYNTMISNYTPNIKFYGSLLNLALSKLGISHLVYRPCLVQHKDITSLLCNGAGMHRQTIYFKDYLDELGIDILESLKPDNVKNLHKLLVKDIEKWKQEVQKHVNGATK